MRFVKFFMIFLICASVSEYDSKIDSNSACVSYFSKAGEFALDLL